MVQCGAAESQARSDDRYRRPQTTDPQAMWSLDVGISEVERAMWRMRTLRYGPRLRVNRRRRTRSVVTSTLTGLPLLSLENSSKNPFSERNT